MEVKPCRPRARRHPQTAVPVIVRLSLEQFETANRLAGKSGIRYQTLLKKADRRWSEQSGARRQIEGLAMNNREFRQHIADLVARQGEDQAPPTKKPPAKEKGNPENAPQECVSVGPWPPARHVLDTLSLIG